MKRKIICFLALALCLAAVLGVAAPAGAAEGVVRVSNTGFPDVQPLDWYEEAILRMQNYTPGIISGIRDADGVLRFHPDDPVKRGEFLKMAMTAAEGFTADHSRDEIHWAGRYYTIAMENNILVADVYQSRTGGEQEVLFPCTFEAMEENISRYEMAVILTNACTNMQMEKPVVVTNMAASVPDFGEIEATAYTSAVEQSYGKGLLTGYTDGSFRGENDLRRCEAAVVAYRMLWSGDRQIPAWASQPEVRAVTSSAAEFGGYPSFALWLQNGHLDAWGKPDAEARRLLFGSENKYYFSSSAEAAPYMESISVPIWIINSQQQKESSVAYLTVHKLVANEVRAIFQMIYDDPERYPIYGYAVGGARFSDTMRHSWGCAIDINPYFNCECNFRSGYQRVTCGYGWWPEGMDGMTWVNRNTSAYHGSMSGPSPYSITPNGSVVRAFAAYGWGWGGSGSNVIGEQRGWSSGNNFDFMHFSVLTSGG